MYQDLTKTNKNNWITFEIVIDINKSLYYNLIEHNERGMQNEDFDIAKVKRKE